MGIFQPNARYCGSDDQGRIKSAIVIHNLAHAEEALAGALAAKRQILLFSPKDAASVLGYEIFIGIIEEAAKKYPDSKFCTVFDCGDKIGIALAVIRAGAKCISFKGNKQILAKLLSVSSAYGVNIVEWPATYLDLNNEKNPKVAIQAYFK